MSDELTPNEPIEPTEPKTFSQEEYDAIIAERDTLKAHNEKVIGESRSAKLKATELEAATLKATEDRLKQAGDYEALMKLAQDKADDYDRKNAELESTKKASALNKESSLIGNELSKDVERSEALSGWAKQYISVNDSGEIEYNVDGIAVSRDKVIELLSSKYAWVVDGPDSSGAGAQGGDLKSQSNNTAAHEAQKKGDLNGFLNASFNKK